VDKCLDLEHSLNSQLACLFRFSTLNAAILTSASTKHMSILEVLAVAVVITAITAATVVEALEPWLVAIEVTIGGIWGAGGESGSRDRTRGRGLGRGTRSGVGEGQEAGYSEE
jgi:hypothetical protein